MHHKTEQTQGKRLGMAKNSKTARETSGGAEREESLDWDGAGTPVPERGKPERGEHSV
jgi:hypothetical protein